MTERVLTQRELNRAVLARQHLLSRSSATLPRALQSVGGLQAQYAPSMYVGLWSRRRDLARADLTAALEQRAAVQATLMRVTIHVVARADYWPLALATRGARRGLWLKARRGAVSDEDMEAGARPRTPDSDRIAAPQGARGARRQGRRRRRRALDRPRRRPAIGHLGASPREPLRRRRGLDRRAGPQHAGRHRPSLRSYLKGFGPASRNDIASYTGLRQRDIVPALERLPLRRFSSEAGDELLDLPRQALPHPDTPAPVRFLPTWDAALLVHARRAGILREEHRPRSSASPTRTRWRPSSSTARSRAHGAITRARSSSTRSSASTAHR